MKTVVQNTHLNIGKIYIWLDISIVAGGID